MITNRILPCELLSYSVDGYATVKLPQYEGDIRDLTIEEVVPVNTNSLSQFNPKIGDKVLVCFDHFGDSYLLGSLHCQQQPFTEPLLPDQNQVVANDNISLKQTALGQFGVTKNNIVPVPPFTNNELLDIILTWMNLVNTSTCPPGSPLSNSVNMVLLYTLLLQFKVP